MMDLNHKRTAGRLAATVQLINENRTLSDENTRLAKAFNDAREREVQLLYEVTVYRVALRHMSRLHAMLSVDELAQRYGIPKPDAARTEAANG